MSVKTGTSLPRAAKSRRPAISSGPAAHFLIRLNCSATLLWLKSVGVSFGAETMKSERSLEAQPCQTVSENWLLRRSANSGLNAVKVSAVLSEFACFHMLALEHAYFSA